MDYRTPEATKFCDYVDIHGRDIHVLMTDDGLIYVPLDEVKKTGFRVFPKAHYSPMNYGKSVKIDEFNKYLLGAAQEYLINNRINNITAEEIEENIQKAREKLFSNEVQLTTKTSLEMFERTFLSDPKEVSKNIRTALNSNSRPSYSPTKNDANSNSRPSFSPGNNGANSRVGFNQELKRPGIGHNRGSNGHSDGSNSDNGSKDGRTRNMQHPRQYQGNQENDRDQFRSLFVKAMELNDEIKTVKVQHIHKGTNLKTKYWVHLTDNERTIAEISEKCRIASRTAPKIAPNVGDIVMARYEEDGNWYRAFVRKTNPVVKILFIDFGNEEVIQKEMKELPKELLNFPPQAIRIIFSNDDPRDLAVEEVANIKFINQYEDATWLVRSETKNQTRNIPPITRTIQNNIYQPILIKTIEYLTSIIDGDIVSIIGYSEGKFYLRNKVCHEQLKVIRTRIGEFPKTKLKKVEPGQAVLHNKENEECLCRAVVKTVDGSLVTIQHIDHFTTATCTLNNLYEISREIATSPVTLLQSPVVHSYNGGKLSEQAQSLLENYIKARTKFTISFKRNEFDLINNENASLLSQHLFKPKEIDLKLRPENSEKKPTTDLKEDNLKEIDLKLRPTNSEQKPTTDSKDDKPKKEQVGVVKAVSYLDMKNHKVPLGSGQFMLMNYSNPGDITFTSTDEEALNYFDQLCHIEVTDDTPVDLEIGDMCLVKYSDSWYRGLVSDKSGNYSVLFVDNGNIESIPPSEIRRLPKELAGIPVIGMACEMKVPNTEAVKKRLKSLLLPEELFEVNVLSAADDFYVVDIPSVRKVLEEEKLI